MLLTRKTVISRKARQMLRLNVADNIGPVDRFKPAPDGWDPIIFPPIEFVVIPLIIPECSE